MSFTEEQMEAIEEEAHEEEARVWRPVWLVVGLIVALGFAGWWFLMRGRPVGAEVPLVLITAPSDARPELNALALAMNALADDLAAVRAAGEADLIPKATELAVRWKALDDASNALAGRLSPQEQRVLVAIRWGGKVLKSELNAILLQKPGNPRRIPAAQRQLMSACTLLEGRRGNMVSGPLRVVGEVLSLADSSGGIMKGLQSIKASKALAQDALNASAGDLGEEPDDAE